MNARLSWAGRVSFAVVALPTDTRNRIEPLARLIRSVPGGDHTVELQDLRLEHSQLGAESGKTRARNLRHPLVTRVGDDPEQFLDTIAPDRSDDPVLGKMGADRIDHRGLLADEEMARPMEHQAALLLECLVLDEPHVCPRDRLADSLGVGSIVLLPLDVRLHVGRRHQTHRMPQRFELARPMMRRSAGFDADEARRQPLKEWQNVPALELTANDYITCRVNSVDLKNRLGDIETNCRDRLHVWLLRIVGALTAPTSMALPCRWRSRPQHHEPTYAVQQNVPLFNHLVGEREQLVWNRNAERLCGLEVEHELEPGRLLDR